MIVVFETGSRAIDSFYIAASKIKNALLISNDKIQVESEKKFRVEAYYLLEEFEEVKKRIVIPWGAGFVQKSERIQNTSKYYR